MINARALGLALSVGTVCQVGMVLLGHERPEVAALFAVGGMAISFAAGAFYWARARAGSASEAAVAGLAAGGICAFVGILVSFALGDVPASLLALGTGSSMVTGAIGALLVRLATRRPSPAAGA